MPKDSATQNPTPALKRQLEAAKLELRQGRFGDARKSYKRILKRMPRLTEALHYLGVLEHMDGNSEEGLALIEQAFRQCPDDFDIRKNLGNLLNDLNRADQAEALYRSLAAEQPDDPSNHSNHAVALRKLGRVTEAIASARRAERMVPDNPAACLALANALGAAGKLRQAAHAYERVIALKPDFSPAHHSLCQTLLQIEQSGLISRHRLKRTRQAYRRWLQAVPGHPTATFLLGALERGAPAARMPDAVVMASFDTYAKDFDKHIRSLDYRAPELIGEVLAHRLPVAKASLDILDGGCGTGLASAMLRPRARQLVGVDLSPEMLKRARATGNYDRLVEGELGHFLRQHPAAFDVGVFVDVLVYFGDLHGILHAAARALRPGGLLAFSVEKAFRPGVHLSPTGRFSHHLEHVHAALTSAGMIDVESRDGELRNEYHRPVAGLVLSARRPPPA